MRYIFVSDIHGQFNKLTEALNRVNFDAQVDTIVSLGDPFDRGPQSKEVLEYLLSCPHRILIAGNHDQRLKEILLHGGFNSCDKSNGVVETLQSFTGRNTKDYGILLMHLKNSADCHETHKKLWQYFGESFFCAEWADLIAVHAWVPTEAFWISKFGNLVGHKYRKDWRMANREDWIEATWSNVEEMIALKNFPEKKLIIGHWHTVALRGFEEGYIAKYDANDNYDVYETDNYIALDGASNIEWGKVNTYVYETDEEPKLYH